MIFLHPEYLWLLLLLIPLIVWYIVRLSKMQASFKLASVNAFKGVKPGLKVYMRHLPFVLRVISIGLIILVIARPQSAASENFCSLYSLFPLRIFFLTSFCAETVTDISIIIRKTSIYLKSNRIVFLCKSVLFKNSYISEYRILLIIYQNLDKQYYK
jgi:hypothetical protein